MYRPASGSFRTLLSLSSVFVYLSALPAMKAQSVSIAFNQNGLSSLVFNNTQFLLYGDLRLNQVTFQNADGSTFQGSTSSTVTVDTVGQTQTRRYGWGSMV